MAGDGVESKPSVDEGDDLEAAPPAATPHAVLQPDGWPSPRGYSNGLLASGRLVVTGGVVGWDVEGRFPATFVDQARLCFGNIVAILAKAGAGPEHLVRLTWYVTDIDEYLSHPRELGAVYREVFGRHYPTMAVVQVTRLVEYSARLVIEATAVLPG